MDAQAENAPNQKTAIQPQKQTQSTNTDLLYLYLTFDINWVIDGLNQLMNCISLLSAD